MASRQKSVTLTTYDGQECRYAGKWRYVVLVTPYLGAGRHGAVKRRKAADSLMVARRAARGAGAMEMSTLWDTWGAAPVKLNPWDVS